MTVANDGPLGCIQSVWDALSGVHSVLVVVVASKPPLSPFGFHVSDRSHDFLHTTSNQCFESNAEPVRGATFPFWDVRRFVCVRRQYVDHQVHYN